VRRPWFTEYKKREIVAIDVEKVILKSNQNTGNAAIVSVVDYDGNKTTVYEQKIMHLPENFVVNRYTIVKNGIRQYDLKNGIPLELLKQKVHDLLLNKLVVVVAGTPDFMSLDLCISSYDTFDLQSVYYRMKLKPNLDVCVCNDYNNCNCYIREPLSLRDMFFHHFKKDIQRGVHSAYEDANATMKVFREGYVPLKQKDNGDVKRQRALSEEHREALDKLPNLNRMEKQNLWYCATVKEFSRKCTCC
jgi:hypothetical protein